jgi:cholesterol oxidase
VSGNGDALAFVRNCAERDEHGHPLRGEDGRERWRYLDPSAGPVITASIHVPAERSPSGRPHELQDAGAPAFSEWMWQALELPGDLWAARRTLARRLRARLQGRRETHLSPLASELLGNAHTSAAMMPMLAMGRDTPNGRYRLDGDQLELDWSPKPSDAYLADVKQSFGRFARAVGGEYDPDPLDALNRGVTVHPLGGCPMDPDARRGVTDAWGRVHGHPGLYVADGALLPGPVGPNPSFTIAALADRVADGILEREPS